VPLCVALLLPAPTLGIPGLVKVLVTGANGFLGWRSRTLLAARGHEVIALVRPDAARRAAADDKAVVRRDAGDPAARDLIAGCDAVLHFAGVPDPARARADPARAVRENAGTTLNLLEGCARHGAGLLYPSTVRAAHEPPPDPYAVSKRLGEEACGLHRAPATVLRLTSVFGPGQVAWEGATGAIAVFAARALERAPIVIPGNPQRTRDFVFVDDVVVAIESIAAEGRWNQTITLASGTAVPLEQAAELTRAAVGSDSPIETPGGTPAAGEDESYAASAPPPGLGYELRSLERALPLYVDWLRRHPAAKGRARA
jgi:nucleoside-diphosphate-sugar epimerase